MSVLTNLRQALGALKLYRLTEDSWTDRELQAYAAGFAPVEEALDRLERNAFLDRCDEDVLARWEDLLLLPAREGLAVDNRRRMVERMLAVTPADQNRSGLLRCLEAVGLDGQLQEGGPLEALIIHSATVLGSYEDLDSLKRTVYGMLPAHLEAQFDIGLLTWQLWEEMGLGWTEWNQADFTWQWFDLYGDQLPPKEE